LEKLPLVEKLKGAFTLYGVQLQYLQKETRFRWCSPDTPSLPTEHGVYCLVSHGGSRIQKIGKAEGKNGLRGRFNGYTGQKTLAKIASDRTDQRWKTVMTGALHGERLSLYYYATVPRLIPLPFPVDDASQPKELECHWARSLEKYLSKLVRDEHKKRGLLETHLLLSGLGD
jgi:hypothetical protein